MRTSLLIVLLVLAGPSVSQEPLSDNARKNPVGVVTRHHRGLHGYIGYDASLPEDRAEFSAGVGFYTAIWPLIGKPIANFQIGLPSAWI